MVNWCTRCKALLLTALAALSGGAQAEANCWRAGARHQVDPLLLYSIAKVESSLNPRAINYNKNGSHDIGLMQINSQHLPALSQRGITRQRLLDDPCLSIQVGASILSGFIQRYGYTWRAVGATTPAARRRARRRASAMWTRCGANTCNCARNVAEMAEYRISTLRQGRCNCAWCRRTAKRPRGPKWARTRACCWKWRALPAPGAMGCA